MQESKGTVQLLFSLLVIIVVVFLTGIIKQIGHRKGRMRQRDSVGNVCFESLYDSLRISSIELMEKTLSEVFLV